MSHPCAHPRILSIRFVEKIVSGMGLIVYICIMALNIAFSVTFIQGKAIISMQLSVIKIAL